MILQQITTLIAKNKSIYQRCRSHTFLIFTSFLKNNQQNLNISKLVKLLKINLANKQKNISDFSRVIFVDERSFISLALEKLIKLFTNMNSYLETQKSPLNNSKFKQLYSFPKANRFSQSSYISPAPFYDNKITALSKRATSLGYGSKFTLQNKEQVPSPNNYSKEGIFQNNIKKAKGYSFSHDSKKGLINELQLKAIPGPGKYAVHTDKNDFKRVSYSFRGKFQDPLQAKKSAVGPGHYETIATMNGNGSYFVSKYSNSGCSKIGNSKRFGSIESISPGPGKYQDTKITSLNTTGIYFNSTYRTNKANAFSQSKRKHIAEPSITPGPGCYNRFSDFPRLNR